MTDPIAVIREAIEVLSRFDIVDHDEDCLKREAIAALDQLESNQALIDELVEALEFYAKGHHFIDHDAEPYGCMEGVEILDVGKRARAALAKAKEER